MKKLTYMATLIVLAQFSAMAKWAPMSKAQLIDYADVIVVATMQEEISVTEKDGRKLQQVSFVVDAMLKGSVGKRIVVHGESSHICKPQVYFKTDQKGEYLLFLRKHSSNGYQVVNGHFGALIVADKSVQWFAGEGTATWQREKQALDVVKREIAAALKK